MSLFADFKKKYLNYIVVGVFFIVGLITYSNTYQSPFVFDDIPNITENANIRLTELSAGNIFKILRHSGRPVATLTLSLNYYFHGYSVYGYHLVNIIIHIINGILLFFLFKYTLLLCFRDETGRMSGSQNLTVIALSASLIWFVNPVQTQSVTYIVQRMTSMAALFYMLSLLMYIKGRLYHGRAGKAGYFAICIASGLLGCGSKQTTVMLPFFIILYEFYFFRNLKFKCTKKQGLIILGLVLAIFSVGAFTLYKPAIDILAIDYTRFEFTTTQRVLTELRVVIFYLSLLFFPHPSRLNLTHDIPLSYSLFSPITTTVSLFVILFMLASAIVLSKRYRLFSFAILWYFGNLVIESTVIKLDIIFEHRLYLPSAFICLFVVTWMYKSIENRTIKTSVIVSLLLILSFWTVERNKVWINQTALWEDCVKKSPNDSRVNNNLGGAYLIEGKYERAIPYLKKAVESDPENPFALYNYGFALQRMDNIGGAEKFYKKTIALEPSFYKAYNELGQLYDNKGDEAQALRYLQKSLKINTTRNFSAFNCIGAVYAKKKDYGNAIEYFKKALAIKPDSVEINCNLGQALAKAGNITELEQYFLNALNINPDPAQTYSKVALAFKGSGQLDSALNYMKKAMALKSEKVDYKNDYAALLTLKRQVDTAISKIDAALKEDPGNYVLFFQKGNIYKQIRALTESVRNYSKALKIRPDSILVLNALALTHLQEKRYGNAIECFKKIHSLRPKNKDVSYNIACLYALDNHPDKSIKWLKEAVGAGYRNIIKIETDPDLANIRSTEAFHVFIKKLRKDLSQL